MRKLAAIWLAITIGQALLAEFFLRERLYCVGFIFAWLTGVSLGCLTFTVWRGIRKQGG